MRLPVPEDAASWTAAATNILTPSPLRSFASQASAPSLPPPLPAFSRLFLTLFFFLLFVPLLLVSSLLLIASQTLLFGFPFLHHFP